jgi:outer membrane protein OmpA-like peptidoglycan-associated protein
MDKDSSGFELISNGSSAILEPLGMKPGEFRFTPAHPGQSSRWIRTCTPTDTFMTELVGRGILRKFELSNTNIDFGKLKVHQHKDTLASILTNQGSVPLTITDVLMAGPDKQQFSLLEGKKNLTILPNAPLMIKARFAPKFRGRTTGSIQVKIQGVSEPQYIQLIGEGLATKELWVSGRTLNSADSLSLNATVNCVDLASGNLIKQVKTNQTGKFGFKLSTDRNYGLVAEKQGFLSTSENIDIREATLADTITRDIYLTQLKGGASIRMNCIFFEFAKANLLPSSKNDLIRIVELLNTQASLTIELQGHTDSIGNDLSNMQLSVKRANAVKEYLMEQGIEAKRLSVKAFGESKPVAANSTEEGRQLNRRVELKIITY